MRRVSYASSMNAIILLLALAPAQSDVEARLDRIEARLDDLESRIGGLGAWGSGSGLDRIEALEKKVTALEKKRPVARRPQNKPQTSAYILPIGDSPVLGDKNAKITFTIFSDYQCPFCARVHPLLAEIAKDRELSRRVNVAFKHFPLAFHKDARPAAKAALAAREQGEHFFWAMSEQLFKHQRTMTAENFSSWAEEIGLDVRAFETDLARNDARYERIIKRDIALGQNAAKVRGTPSLFVGGWALKTRSVEGVKQLIRDKNL